MPYWTHIVDWVWIGALMIVWLLFIGALGCAAVLAAWRHTSYPGRHARPKSA